MKISRSKQELARIISENGGWRDGEFTAQDGDGTGSIDFFRSKPKYHPDSKFWRGRYVPSERIERADVTIKNFHQTLLSRDEYFHLYPAPDADGWIEWNGGACPVGDGVSVEVKRERFIEVVDNPEEINWVHYGTLGDIIAYRLHKPEQAKPEPVKAVEAKPTIEQLAADYRNAKDYADRKQQEADAAKADADIKLKALELACEAIGLLVSPIAARRSLSW